MAPKRSFGDLSDFKVFALAERLSQKDAVIAQALTEKLQLFADLAESVIGPEDMASRSRLLLRGDAQDLQQGEMLLKEAITDGTLLWLYMRTSTVKCCVDVMHVESPNLTLTCPLTSVEKLQNLLQSRPSEEAPSSRLEDGNGSGALPRRAVTFGGYDSSPTVLSKSASHTLDACKKSPL